MFQCAREDSQQSFSFLLVPFAREKTHQRQYYRFFSLRGLLEKIKKKLPPVNWIAAFKENKLSATYDRRPCISSE